MISPSALPLLMLLASGLSNLDPAPDRITIEPTMLVFHGGITRQQVAVSGHFADGSVRDLSALTQFSVDRTAIAHVSASGVIARRGEGETTLRVEVAGHSAQIPIRVDPNPSPPRVSYRLDVAPVLSKSGCNMGACHGNLNGKGGFRLSLRGEDPGFDLTSITREAFGRRVEPNLPDSSLLLLKPTGQVAHEGGLRIVAGSIEHHTLREWIASGLHDDVATAPRLTKLTVWPADRYLGPSSTGEKPGQQLIVTAAFADGTTRDVTRQASYDVNDPGKASVSADGRVDANGPGEVVIAVRYLEGRGVSRLAFLADRPDFAWNDDPGPSPIDQAVFAKLKALRVQPSQPADDATFLRRAYLDAIGVLPTVAEARAFLSDSDPAKRAKLVDLLVDREEFADFWALKWADVLRNEEKSMGAKGLWSFQRWLRDQIADDVPLDEFTRQIVTGQGSTWQNPPASFHRTNRDPQTAAESIGQVFLGVRLQCARCHNHPFDVWTQDDYFGLSAYFGNVKRREVDNVRKDDLDKHEINGDIVVYLKGSPTAIQPRTGRKLPPKPPGGPAPDLKGDDNALDDLALWLTKGNPQFARNQANRVWFHLMGRGVVEPVDDFRDSNPPSNPALLDAITTEFTTNGMRLKPLVATIMKSRVYAFGSTPNATNADDEANFARSAVKLLPAEVLLDAIGSALGKEQPFSGMPRTLRATQLPGVSVGGDFLKTFGKPERLLTCECERSESTTLSQAFQLINGESVRKRLTAFNNRIGKEIDAKTPDPALLETLYLAAVSRSPNEDERQTHLSYVARSSDRRKAWEDVAWAIVNSKEFLLRH